MRLSAAALLAIALLGCAGRVSAQSPRDELGVRIDSLAAEYERQLAIVDRLDSVADARAARMHTDTVIVGPFLIIDRDTVDVRAVARALADAWSARAASIGVAAERIDPVVTTLTLGPELMRTGASGRMHPFEPFVTGRADFPRAAERLVSNVLTAELPDDVREWLGSVTLQRLRRLDWTYRELATTKADAARDCFREEADACRTALGLGATPIDDAGLSRATRATLLEHALAVGGAGSYARLFTNAPDVSARLANAAGVPLNELITGWREAMQAERPNIHAGVARAGFWTVVWLAVLALLAMRSTRWRLG